MDLGVLCDPGCEAAAVAEVADIIGKKAAVKAGYVTIAACTAEEVARLTYHAQSASRILLLISEGELSTVEDISKEPILAFDFTPYLKEGGSFRITCQRHGEHEFQAREVEEYLGAALHDEKQFPVKLEKPDIDIFCAIHEKSYVIGIDLTGRDLGKREYKAFHTRRSLRATIAYAAIRIAGYTGKEVLIDPFMVDGTIPIEAGLFATRTSPYKFKHEFSFMQMPFAQRDWKEFFAVEDEKASDKTGVTGLAAVFPALKSSKANAKLAGIEKAVSMTKSDVTWLDTKFEKESVDFIVSAPITSGKSTPLKDVEKEQDDLFYQAKFVLKPEGNVLLIAEKKAELLNAAEHHSFKLVKEQTVLMGEKELLFLHFVRA